MATLKPIEAIVLLIRPLAIVLTLQLSLDNPNSDIQRNRLTPMDSPIHIDTISMKLSTLYFKRLPIKISIKLCISVHEDCFYLSKQCRA